MAGSGDALAVTVAIMTALAAVVVAVLAGASGPSPAAPACTEWTDGCIVCSRATGAVACSTPGIACVRGPVRCLKP